MASPVESKGVYLTMESISSLGEFCDRAANVISKLVEDKMFVYDGLFTKGLLHCDYEVEDLCQQASGYFTGYNFKTRTYRMTLEGLFRSVLESEDKETRALGASALYLALLSERVSDISCNMHIMNTCHLAQDAKGFYSLNRDSSNSPSLDKFPIPTGYSYSDAGEALYNKFRELQYNLEEETPKVMGEFFKKAAEGGPLQQLATFLVGLVGAVAAAPIRAKL